MDRERYERGLEIRREVLGAEYVERSLANADELNREFQELVTEYCWGAVWGRDGLPRPTRSLINLAMLAALGRTEELKLHLAGAVRNGCTRDEIREVLLQVTIYCGVPAGIEAFRAARAVLAETPAPETGDQAERLAEFRRWVDEWEGEPLPFRFEDGEFSYTPMLAQYRPEWRQP